jgi:hypothetical protein
MLLDLASERSIRGEQKPRIAGVLKPHNNIRCIKQTRRFLPRAKY